VRHPEAFADHAAEFWLTAGADPSRAPGLARINLAVRATPRAHDLLRQATFALETAGPDRTDEDRIHWRVSIRLLLGRAFKRSDDFVRVPSIGVSCTGGRSHLRARRIAAVITKLGQAL
jgi:hypothetical protein